MTQLTFDDLGEKLTIDKPIRLIELFGGIGAQAKALENLGANFERYKMVDVDKYAVASYNAIHKTAFNPQDITKVTGADLGIVDTDKFCYILTYSFPCTDISSAGKQKGMVKGSGTRSSLLWEVERLLKETKELPQILVMENVPWLISNKNLPDFFKWLSFLDCLGYWSKWKVLDARSYGIPQKRERCFMVSFRERRGCYNFPAPYPAPTALKDMLYEHVNKKYFLSADVIKALEAHRKRQEEKGNGFGWRPITKNAPYARTIATECGWRSQSNFIIVSADGIRLGQSSAFARPALKNAARCIMTDDRNGVVIKTGDPKIIQRAHGYNSGGILNECPTITANAFQENNYVFTGDEKIRRLTPKECWLLMGFSKDDFKAAAKVNSATQLYKQAGNSIVVTCLMAIFGEMLKIDYNRKIKAVIKNIKIKRGKE